jgi:hypothetical protein
MRPTQPQVTRLLHLHLRRDARSWEDVARVTVDWQDWLAVSPALTVTALRALRRAAPRGLPPGAVGSAEAAAAAAARARDAARGTLARVEGAATVVALGLDPVAWASEGGPGAGGAAASGGSGAGAMPPDVRGTAAVAARLLALARRQAPGMEPEVGAWLGGLRKG